jgi:hypothetical protein
MNQEEILRRAAEAAKNMKMEPTPHQQGVQPQPSPISINLSHGKSQDGTSFVVLTIQHLTGSSVFYVDADGAEKIGDMLKETARLARTGLEIVR